MLFGNENKANDHTQQFTKILSTCLQGNYRDSIGEFSNASCGVLGAERVNGVLCLSSSLSSQYTKFSKKNLALYRQRGTCVSERLLLSLCQSELYNQKCIQIVTKNC